MSRTSKSPLAVTLAAYAAAKKAIPAYAHRFSPHKFTQPQLLACLVFKTYENTDYRGASQRLCDNPTLCARIGLQAIPHWTTLQGR